MLSAPLTLFVIRILHVVIGAFWVGAVLFIAAFLAPSVRAAGPAGGAVMQQLMGARRMHLWLMAAGILWFAMPSSGQSASNGSSTAASLRIGPTVGGVRVRGAF